MKELILTCVVKREQRGGYSALCPELDVASRGDTLEEAQKNLQEAVTGHLQTARQEGLLDDILQRLGVDGKALAEKDHHIIPPTFSSPLPVPLPA